jgi:uncharacterized membrane protein YoaK (UPF0700 family)
MHLRIPPLLCVHAGCLGAYLTVSAHMCGWHAYMCVCMCVCMYVCMNVCAAVKSLIYRVTGQYETMQRSLQQQKSQEGKSSDQKQAQRGGGAVLWLSMVTGAVAGGLGTLITTPMDVVKTRIMVSPHIYRYDLWHFILLSLDQGLDA